MNRRDQWVAGVALLRAYLRDDLALARALRERRWTDVLAAAEIASGEVDHDLALTDPALYRTLRDAITKYHLRGYGGLDVQSLRLIAAREIKAPTTVVG